MNLQSSNLTQDFGALHNPSIYNDIQLQGPIHDTKIRLIRKGTHSSDEEKGLTNDQPFQKFKAIITPKDTNDINSSPQIIAPSLPINNQSINSDIRSDLLKL